MDHYLQKALDSLIEREAQLNAQARLLREQADKLGEAANDLAQQQRNIRYAAADAREAARA